MDEVCMDMGKRIGALQVSRAAADAWLQDIEYPVRTLERVATYACKEDLTEHMAGLAGEYVASPERVALFSKVGRSACMALLNEEKWSVKCAHGVQLLYGLADVRYACSGLEVLCKGVFDAAQCAGVSSDGDFVRFCADVALPIILDTGERTGVLDESVFRMSAQSAYEEECRRGSGVGLWAVPFWIGVARELSERVHQGSDTARRFCELHVEGVTHGLLSRGAVAAAPNIAVDVLYRVLEDVHRYESGLRLAVGMYGDAPPPASPQSIGALEFVLSAYNRHRGRLTEFADYLTRTVAV